MSDKVQGKTRHWQKIDSDSADAGWSGHEDQQL